MGILSCVVLPWQKFKKLYSKQKEAIKALSVTSEDYSGLKIEDLMEKNRHSQHLQIKYIPHNKS